MFSERDYMCRTVVSGNPSLAWHFEWQLQDNELLLIVFVCHLQGVWIIDINSSINMIVVSKMRLHPSLQTESEYVKILENYKWWGDIIILIYKSM